MDTKHLLNQMTFDEKIGQLLQIAPFFFIRHSKAEVAGEITDLGLTKKEIFNAGSVLGIGSAEEMMEVQKLYLEHHRLGIPLIFMADIVHGYETIFPVPIAMASSFNENLVRNAAKISAIEASTSGIHVTFAPMADLVRDPRWGRVVESFGEDPYLNEMMVQASVEGFQQSLSDERTLASCVKHFAGYGASEAGRDYNTVDLSRVALHNGYLNGYKRAIDAGAKLIMTSFNVIEGIPATVNQYLLREVLRDLWHFKGVTISDYDSLHQILAHGCATDDQEAAQRGMTAGLDIEMASTCYIRHLEQLVLDEVVSMDLIDEAVLRVLNLKNDLGLFENPYRGASITDAKTLVLSSEHLDESLKAAYESLVLLENDGILPLDKSVKMALIGPHATDKQNNGPWSWKGNQTINPSLYDALTAYGAHVMYMNDQTDVQSYQSLDYQMMADADVVILALGEHTKESGEAHSKASLRLPRNQEALFHLVKKHAKKVVTLITAGRPLLLNEVKASNALMYTWFLGTRHAEAVVHTLYGKNYPSGKLPMSFPRCEGQIPIYYNHLNTGRPYQINGHNEFTSHYLDVSNEPLYTFGEGMTYTSFFYAEPKLSHKEMRVHDVTHLEIEITNKGLYPGDEIVMLFIKDRVATISRPVKELKKWAKIHLNPGDTKTVVFELSASDLSYFNSHGHRVIEPGWFDIMVGPNAKQTQTLSLKLIKG
ncbi:MAG: glycoside hydrolase family 3 N-terminal domain-containing protein [Acholeplasmataceae bacterium]|nr:glycoside hydrolase family 3 N-terminal domain-containing protein [Acholeplasmataceae bacterium]